MHTTSSPYEVRCPRCDVTFPVETRTCIHCGEPIGRRDQVHPLESILESGFETEAESPVPIEFRAGPLEGEIEMPDEPSSVGRSLIRSLGGLVWVVVLIAFTIARNCGGE
jgi:hypothetical protein